MIEISNKEILRAFSIATHEVTLVQGFAAVDVKGGGNNVTAGVLTGDFMLRLPLDDFWPGVHLAPYFFGFGGIILGSGGEGHSVSETFTVTNSAGETRDVTFTGRRVNSLRNNIGEDRVLGHFGGGLEYRFTPHIGLPNGLSVTALRHRTRVLARQRRKRWVESAAENGG